MSASSNLLGKVDFTIKKLPAEANVQMALASYCERGGLRDKARAAREKAKKLGAVLPEK